MPILLTACSSIRMKNVTKCLNQLNHRGIGTLTFFGIIFSFNRILILFSFNNIDIQFFLPIQSVLSMNINLPVRKLLFSINQWLIYFYLQFTIWFTIFSTEPRKQICIK